MVQQATFPWIPVVAARAARRTVGAPRMAQAVRIPLQLSQLGLGLVPLGPQIFVHEGARQALERRFEVAAGGPVQLAITDNRRSIIRHARVRGTLKVRVHMMFLGATDRVLDALVRWVVADDPQASQVVGAFITNNGHRIKASRPPASPVRTRGSVHDLAAILAEVNARYFGGGLTDVLVTWGRRSGAARRPRKSIKLGSYSATERLVRVHPALDAAWVPRYFLAYIVYHELLHHVLPARVVGGRAVLHPPEFREREREFRHFQRALAWEQRHLGRLLRAR